MSDVYLYYFFTRNGPNEENMLSTRPATLETIKDRGEPVMESQIVVDLDAEGFLVGTVGNDSYAINDIAAQIGSLEVRAASRDIEAKDSADGVEKYMLHLESRELRKQARILKNQRTEVATGELAYRGDTGGFLTAGGSLATE